MSTVLINLVKEKIEEFKTVINDINIKSLKENLLKKMEENNEMQNKKTNSAKDVVNFKKSQVGKNFFSVFNLESINLGLKECWEDLKNKDLLSINTLNDLDKKGLVKSKTLTTQSTSIAHRGYFKEIREKLECDQFKESSCYYFKEIEEKTIEELYSDEKDDIQISLKSNKNTTKATEEEEATESPKKHCMYGSTNLSVNSAKALVSCMHEEWDHYFHYYYIDASENYNGNFDNYLTSALKLMNLMPHFNWKSEIEKKKINLNSSNQNNCEKMTLILDLDETLIHSDFDFTFSNHDAVIKFDNSLEGFNTLIPILLRPDLAEFLEYCANKFEVVCFTASSSDYADAILNYLDPHNKIFSYRVYRESCLYLQPGIYIKDISIFENRDPSKLIIVDNSLFSFCNQLSNGILVTSFYNDKEDKVLDSVVGYLENVILQTEDVRKSNYETFRFEIFKEELKEIVHVEIAENNEQM